MKKKASLNIPDWVLEKMRYFCSYQERCMADVSAKLKELHLRDELIEETIKQLVREDMLDEQRFANIYASGKLRIKNWGRKKIRYALYQKKVPEIYVEIALRSIDEDEYFNILKEVIHKKAEQLNETDSRKKIQKLYRFAQSRGFETHLITTALKSVAI